MRYVQNARVVMCECECDGIRAVRRKSFSAGTALGCWLWSCCNGCVCAFSDVCEFVCFLWEMRAWSCVHMSMNALGAETPRAERIGASSAQKKKGGGGGGGKKKKKN